MVRAERKPIEVQADEDQGDSSRDVPLLRRGGCIHNKPWAKADCLASTFLPRLRPCGHQGLQEDVAQRKFFSPHFFFRNRVRDELSEETSAD